MIGPRIYDELEVGKNLFAIGLQKKQQLDMFIKHSNKLNLTHETNQYEFPLITLVVVNEINKGNPVGFFISNYADELSLRPFLEETKKRCPEDLKINTIMTDDDNSGNNAFTNVFGQWNTICYVRGTLLGPGKESCQNLLLKGKLKMNYTEHF